LRLRASSNKAFILKLFPKLNRNLIPHCFRPEPLIKIQIYLDFNVRDIFAIKGKNGGYFYFLNQSGNYFDKTFPNKLATSFLGINFRSSINHPICRLIYLNQFYLKASKQACT
jgi:hypothetical protein